MENTLTLGSLFEGSGGFSLAGMLSGITPRWASEIEPFPIRVTTRRLPQVKHYGDITKMKGSELEPVDMITFGSPCFPAGTLILTDMGLREIETIKAGDMVLTHKGRWRKVTAVGAKVAPTISLKGSHPGLVCTKNHPIYSRNGGESIWIQAQDMLHRQWGVPNRFEHLPIPAKERENSKQKPFPELSEGFFYFVGRWLGDGWVYANQRPGRPEGQRCSTIYLCDSEDKLDELKNTISCITEHYSIEYGETCVKVKCCCRLLCDWLTENFGKYAHAKEIPSWCLSMPVNYRESLLKGIIESDGYEKEKYYRITTVSKKLAYGIRLLAETLGHPTAVYLVERPRKYTIEGRSVNQRDCYITQISKAIRSGSDSDGISWYRVKGISEEDEASAVYNMTVEEDNSYTADGIIVHNCQDMSIAGKRDGLGGSRSSLFYEAIRIAKEMREATNNTYPRYLVWENVFGAFSSNKGKDFHAVIEEFVKIKHPESTVPESEKWSGAGLVLAEDFSLAWRVLDAQHWGVPQRRRRIYLVADLDGERAGNILFESEGLPWNTEACGIKGQGSSESVEEGSGETDRDGFPCLFRNHAKDFHYEGPLESADTILAQYGTGGNNAPFVVHDNPRTFDVRFTSEGTRNARQNVYETDTSRTIDTGGNSPDSNQGGVAVVYGISSHDSNAMKSANPHSGIYVADTTRTLDANGGNPGCNQGGMVVVEGCGSRPSHKGDGYREADVSYTLNTVEPHGVAYGIGKTALSSGFNSDMSFPIEEETMPTIISSGPNGVGQPLYSTSKNSHHTTAEKDLVNTLVASDWKDPPTVTEPSYGFYPQMKAEGNCFTEEKSPTIVIGTNPGWQNAVVEQQYIVRRLTPTECARLQGFPDWWCSDLGEENPSEEELQFWRSVFLTHSEAIGKAAKPKSDNELRKWLKDPHTDSAEYKMWGNGIALPCARYVLTGIAHYDKEKQDEEISDR